MSFRKIRNCQCRPCLLDLDHPDKEHHQQLIILMNQLTPAQRRLYAAIESHRLGCQLIQDITGMCPATLKRGRAELAKLQAGIPLEAPKGRTGRPCIERKYPEINSVLAELIADHTAGDPMTNKKWVRISSRNLSERLAEKGYKVNYHTICRLLRQLGYSMKVNVKKRAIGHPSPHRDAQFKYISATKANFQEAGDPVISVDAKKKELIGNFKVNGAAWCKTAQEVEEHRFASRADCVATPYGVYDVSTNKGYVCVGTSHNTPKFAVTAIKKWWYHAGHHVYSDSKKLLIFTDGGGSNGTRCRAWKQQLQKEICDRFHLTVTVCHYPPHCSKHNPIERRLFSHISMNWSGKPLSSLEIMLGYIRGTKTRTGLSVEAFLIDEVFEKRQGVTKREMDELLIEEGDTCPKWNYTIRPRIDDYAAIE